MALIAEMGTGEHELGWGGYWEQNKEKGERAKV